ncbi:MAG TPA: hypothetical protein PK637_16415 [Flavobacteriales bacterium]|nr:hypothetical protein [Flavobacteriales bacterium]HRE98350.1 hypothetical protein [Flavobacteriales bacterium]HRJ34747.1 hypothetical protein [Flavobacteriales bacterium]HRJ39980.1 hypothetical protein [Flavobacteriales bacterium]
MAFVRILFLLLILQLFNGGNAFAQGDTIRIKVKVTDADNPHIWMNFFAVNKRSKQGTFGDRWSEFDMIVIKTDTITIKSNGYIPVLFSMKDSVSAPLKVFTVKMHKEAILLPEATVVVVREFKEIEKDIKRLEMKKTSPYTGNYTKIASPITALYEAFSKVEQEKRKASKLEYEDRKRELLKELLAKYVKGDIITLSESEFDDFIAFADPDMEFLQRASQYDLIMYFKTRFMEYDLYVRVKNLEPVKQQNK